jgi:hypothetical protein
MLPWRDDQFLLVRMLCMILCAQEGWRRLYIGVGLRFRQLGLGFRNKEVRKLGKKIFRRNYELKNYFV